MLVPGQAPKQHKETLSQKAKKEKKICTQGHGDVAQLVEQLTSTHKILVSIHPWAEFSVYSGTALERSRQRDKKYKVIPDCVLSLRPA